jgi:hypothetical protein
MWSVRVRLDRGSGLLAGEPASSWCYFWLGGGLRSMSLRLLPLLTSVKLLKGQAGIRPWHHRLQWNHHHGLNDRSILHSWCRCDGSGRSRRAMTLGRGEVEAPLTA